MCIRDRVSRVADVIFQCNSVPGAQQHTIQRKTILQGVDGIIFVWDSQNTKWKDNLWSFEELLRLYGSKIIPDDTGLSEVPFVMVANKRDLQKISPVDKIKEVLMATGLGNTLIYETIATKGINIKKAFVYCAREITLNYYHHYSGMHPGGKEASTGLSDF